MGPSIHPAFSEHAAPLQRQAATAAPLISAGATAQRKGTVIKRGRRAPWSQDAEVADEASCQSAVTQQPDQRCSPS